MFKLALHHKSRAYRVHRGSNRLRVFSSSRNPTQDSPINPFIMSTTIFEGPILTGENIFLWKKKEVTKYFKSTRGWRLYTTEPEGLNWKDTPSVKDAQEAAIATQPFIILVVFWIITFN